MFSKIYNKKYADKKNMHNLSKTKILLFRSMYLKKNNNTYTTVIRIRIQRLKTRAVDPDPDPHGSAFIFLPGSGSGSRRVNMSTKN